MILTIVLILISSICIISAIKLANTNNENERINESITEIRKNNIETLEKNKTLMDEVNKLKEENPGKWQELKIWEKAKRKLTE